jgi:hypothetical protein
VALGVGSVAGCGGDDSSSGGVSPSPTGTATTTPTSTATATTTQQQPPPTPPTFAVAGTIEGLQGSGFVIGNGADQLSLIGDGPFSFPTRLNNGAGFDVQIVTQPSSPTEKCSIASGSPGAINGADANVSIVCTRTPFSVGGNVSGLSAGTITLRNKGGDDIVVSADGTFTFPTQVPSGSPYNVTVANTTGGASCTVTAGSGTVGNGDVKGVLVNCDAGKFPVGGTVTGLSGLLQLQLGASVISLTGAGPFVFPAPFTAGTSYSVTISKQPGSQTCSISAGGSGTVGQGSGTAVKVACSGGGTAPHSVDVTVTGLVDWGDGITLTNNGLSPIAVAQDGVYSFPLQNNGTTWSVATTSPTAPPQTCTVDVSNGTISFADAAVNVTCTAPTIGNWLAAGGGWSGLPCYDGIAFQPTAVGVAAGCTTSNGVLGLAGGVWTPANTGIDNLSLSAVAYMPGGGVNGILLGAVGVVGKKNIYRGTLNSWTNPVQSVEMDVPASSPTVAFTMYGARLVSSAGPMVSSWDPRGHAATITNFIGGSGSGGGHGTPNGYTIYWVGNATGTARTIANVPSALPTGFAIDPLDSGSTNTRDFLAVYGQTPNGDPAVGGVYFSANAGHSWTDMTNNIPGSERGFIWTVRADPTTVTPAARTIYVGLRGGAKIYKSTDTGVTWTAFGTGIPGEAEVLSIYASGATMYAGTTLGLFKYNGTKWAYVGFANLKVRAVASDGTNTFVGVEDATGLYKPGP